MPSLSNIVAGFSLIFPLPPAALFGLRPSSSPAVRSRLRPSSAPAVRPLSVLRLVLDFLRGLLP